jgi:murein DD-endopeptidase MepM/ murein hydrolase activator NlpD
VDVSDLRRWLLRVLLSTFSVLLVAAAGLAQPAPTLAVTVLPAGKAWRPGSVVRVEVRVPSPIARVEGTVHGQPVTFVVAADGRSARGLLGLAADLAAGEYEVAVRAEAASGGAAIEGSATLTVAKAVFRSQTLRVDPRFVQPPKDELPRIEKERAHLAELSHHVDREHPWSAPFAAPLDSAVTESYGTRRTFNGELASQHRGVDLKGAMGTPIAAPGSGRVVLADELYYTGNTVVIDHGAGVVSLLAHMSQIGVKVGDAVDAGAIVGEVGATGRVTGPHLHWSAWVGGTSIDPMSLIAAINSVSRNLRNPRNSAGQPRERKKRVARAAAPKPLSMLTTASPLAQLVSMPSSAASPLKLAP